MELSALASLDSVERSGTFMRCQKERAIGRETRFYRGCAFGMRRFFVAFRALRGACALRRTSKPRRSRPLASLTVCRPRRRRGATRFAASSIAAAEREGRTMPDLAPVVGGLINLVGPVVGPALRAFLKTTIGMATFGIVVSVLCF